MASAYGAASFPDVKNPEHGDQPPAPLAPDLRRHWMLKEGVAFFNHGSFGATPREVFAAQNVWRERIEAEPVELLGRRNFALLAEARKPIGEFLGMEPGDFGFVTNATEGINGVLRSLRLSSGEELLTTTHVYHAVRQAMRLKARQHGATLREVDIPLPVESAGQILRTVSESLSAKTRLLVIDQVTSPTALVFPVQAIADECRRRGIDILIDGAHAPGMLALNVEKLGATYYAANLHKWVCAPKGSAFLWVRPDRQKEVHPTIVSHFLDEGFASEFGWQGTRDISPWLAAPAAIAFMGQFGWTNVMEHNHRLAVWAHRHLCRAWDVEAISPLDGSLIGSTATIMLPGRWQSLSREQVEAMQQRIYDDYHIEVPLMRWNDRVMLRVSCQVYNVAAEYEKLAGVILDLEGRL